MQASLSGQKGPHGGRLIDVENGYVTEVLPQADGSWQVKFLDRALKPVPAPDVDVPKITGITIEAIGADKIVRTLVPAKGPDANTLVATGKTQNAEYARIHMSRGGHWAARYALLNGKMSEKVPAGPHGGHFIEMGHDQYIELVPKSAGTWHLCFYEDDNSKVDAPDATLIGAEALGADGTITNLVVTPGPDASTLVATGRTDGAVRARILWAHPEQHNPHWHRREINI